MTPEDVITLFRAEFGDTVAPHLWSEGEAAVYLTEAHRQFVLGLGGIPDIVPVDYLPDEPFSNITPLLHTVRKAYHPDGEPLTTRNIEELDTTSRLYRPDNRRYRPLELVLGLKRNQVRWMPVPSEAGAIELAIYRASSLVVTSDTIETAEFEIEDQYHRSLVYGMAAQALLKHDAETFDEQKAQELQARFFGVITEAKAARDKRDYTPRSIVYGGPEIGGNSYGGRGVW
jgi:hypothetical protein